CRTSDGYTCANPVGFPWYASNLEANQGQKVCIQMAGLLTQDNGADFTAPICAPGLVDSGPFTGNDGAVEAAAADAGEGGADAGAEDAAGAPDGADDSDAGAADASVAD